MGNARFANRFVCLHFDGVQLSENTEQWDTLGKTSQRWCVDKQIRNEPTQWKNTINASCKKGGEPSPNVKAMRWEVSKFLSDNITLSMILVIAIFSPVRGDMPTWSRGNPCEGDDLQGVHSQQKRRVLLHNRRTKRLLTNRVDYKPWEMSRWRHQTGLTDVHNAKEGSNTGPLATPVGRPQSRKR